MRKVIKSSVSSKQPFSSCSRRTTFAAISSLVMLANVIPLFRLEIPTTASNRTRVEKEFYETSASASQGANDVTDNEVSGRRKDNKDWVFLKLHKVSSTTWQNALKHGLPRGNREWHINSHCLSEEGKLPNLHPGQNNPLGHGTVKRYSREGRKGIERCYDNSTTTNNVAFVTVLRDPVDKVISWIFSKVGGLGYNIPQLEIEHLETLSNINCRQGSMFEYTLTFGYPFVPPLFVNDEYDRECPEPFEKMFDLKKTLYNDIRIEQRAVEVVTSSSEIDIVMLKERQCENLIILSDFLSGTFRDFCPRKIAHHRPTEGKEERINNTSQVVLDQLRDMLRIEYSIYNAAVERFNNTVNAIVAANGGNLTALFEQVQKECPIFDCGV